MSKKMKKFFSLMLVALVMLGVTACEQDVTIDTPKSEGLSFYAEIAMTRADLEQGADSKWTTVWEGNETLYVNEFAFTNTVDERSKFTCTTEGVAKLLGQDVTIKMENNSVPESGKGIMIEQAITAFDPTSTITLTAKNAFFRFTYTGDVTFTLSQPLFVVEGSEVETITVTADGETWVSVLPGTADLSFVGSTNGETKTKDNFNIVAGKIYNLGVLTDTESQNIVTDTLNRALTGVTGTSYTDWSDKTVTSTAVYAGNSAGGNSSIQLRSNNSNSGIVTTTSGGKVKKVVVTWNSNTTDGRTLNIYGKNTAYAAATDLYDDSTQGTLLGTIVYGTSTELVIEGDYEYIGMHSDSGAMYLAEIQITWDASNVVVDTRKTLETPVIEVAEVTTNSIKVSWSVVDNATSYDVAIDGGDPVNIDATEYTFDNLSSGTQYEISVVAKADGYKDSVAGTTTISTKAKPIIENGNYVIVAKSSTVMLTNAAEGSALAHKSIDNIDVDKVTTTDESVWYIEWDETNSYYLIKSVGNGCYLSATNGNTASATKTNSDDYCHMIISEVEGGYNIEWKNSTSGKRILGYNTSSPRFAFYTSSQDNTLLIIPAEVDTKPSFTVIPTDKQSIGAEGGNIQFIVDAINGAVVTAVSSDTTWLTIDGTFNATVDPNETAEARSATITFSAEDCDDVVVTVSQARSFTGVETETATLSFADKAQRTTYTTEQQVWVQNDITFTNNKASSTTNVGDYANPVRLYKSSEIVIEVPGNITQIVFDCNSSDYATALKDSITDNCLVSSDKVTVTLDGTSNTYKIASLSGGQVRIDTLTVTYVVE